MTEPTFSRSNLSKIKPKLRTSGATSWPRRKAGSSLNELGATKAERVLISPRANYIQRMILLYEQATDSKMKLFAFEELHRLNCFEEKRIAPGPTSEPFKGPPGAS